MKQYLSPTELRFWDSYLATGNIAASAKHAGSNGKNTHNLHETGRKILERLGVTLQDVQEAMGITDSYLTEKLQRGLSATKRYYGTWRGDIVEGPEIDDTPTRLKALEIAHRLRGQFIDRHELTGKDGGDISLVVSAPVKGKGKKTVSF